MKITLRPVPGGALAVAAAAALLLVSGCSSGGSGSTTSNSAPTPTSTGTLECPSSWPDSMLYSPPPGMTSSPSSSAVLICEAADADPGTSAGATTDADLVNISDDEFFDIQLGPDEAWVSPHMYTMQGTSDQSSAELVVATALYDIDPNISLLAPEGYAEVSVTAAPTLAATQDDIAQGADTFLLWLYEGVTDQIHDDIFKNLSPAGKVLSCAMDAYKSWNDVQSVSQLNFDYSDFGDVNAAFTKLYEAAGVVDDCRDALNEATNGDAAAAVTAAATQYGNTITKADSAAEAAGESEDLSWEDIIDAIADAIGDLF